MTSVFKDLSQIDVSKHLEEKQGLSYLQWMAALAIAKDYDPAMTVETLTDSDGKPYFNSEEGAFVGVTVTIKDQTVTEYLPVLDYRNKAVKGDKLGVFDINSAIKRCMVKALAMLGLGAQVYINGQGTPLNLEGGLGKAKEAPKAPKAKRAAATNSF